MKKLAVGYLRVSTQDQAEEGVSLDAQKAKIEAWCELNDYKLVGIYEDAGISGCTLKKRPGLQAAMDHIQEGAALISYSISRLSRSTKDMLSIAETLSRRGADLVSLSENIDTTTAAGRMVFRLLASLAEFERDQISERTKAALAHKKSQGQKYAPVPFGYRDIDGKLVAIPRELRIVADILKAREAGQSLAAIANKLNSDRVKGKRGGKWYPSTVRYVIRRQAA